MSDRLTCPAMIGGDECGAVLDMHTTAAIPLHEDDTKLRKPTSFSWRVECANGHVLHDSGDPEGKQAAAVAYDHADLTARLTALGEQTRAERKRRLDEESELQRQIERERREQRQTGTFGAGVDV